MTKLANVCPKCRCTVSQVSNICHNCGRKGVEFMEALTVEMTKGMYKDMAKGVRK